MIANRAAVRIIERNAMAYRRMWMIFVAGFAEPILYLLSIGVGVGALVGGMEGPGGRQMSYEAFVAPGMMAAAAMNGSVLDTTFNFFVKFKYMKIYDTMLATPMRPGDLAAGEVAWGQLRGAGYSTVFLVAMVTLGLVESWWAVLAVPAALLIGFAFAGAGLAATTFMRSFTDFDYVWLALVPMFLFSATFYPLSRYPEAVQWVVRATPLYHGATLLRALTVGVVGWGLLAHVLYLVVMGAVGVRIASTRLKPLLQP